MLPSHAKEVLMNNDLIQVARALRKGQVLHFRRGRGQRFECLSGNLWITLDGDPRDIILEAGDGFTVDADGAILVSALSDVRFVWLQATPRITETRWSGASAY
jgi:hypothetical protein